MGDFVSFEMITKPFTDFRIEQARVTDRTTMYALRAAGRKIASTAKATPIPVVTGDLRKSVKNSKRLNHIGTGDYSMKMGPFGRTKAGTSVARHGGGISAATARAAAVHGITLASRKTGSTKGQVRGVPLYRTKVNDQTRFMQAGVTAMDAVARETFETAYARAFQRFR